MPPRKKKRAAEKTPNQPLPPSQKTKPKKPPATKPKSKNQIQEDSQARLQKPASSEASKAAGDLPAEVVKTNLRRSARLLGHTTSSSSLPLTSTFDNQRRKLVESQEITKSLDARLDRKESDPKVQDEHPTGLKIIESASIHDHHQISASTQDPGVIQSIEEATDKSSQSLVETNASSCSETEEPLLIPYCDAELLVLIEAISADPNFGIMIAKANKNLVVSLPDMRNVNVEPIGTPDAYADTIRGLKSELPLDPQVSANHLEIFHDWWNFDRARCINSNEAIFQRLLMVQMIDRHRLFDHSKLHDGKNKGRRFCDFSVEQQWVCPSMPSREDVSESLWSPSAKPDLCVSFLASNIIEEDHRSSFPMALKELISFEGLNWPHIKNIFPFLIIEAKNGYTSPDDNGAFHQCLNSASQALHMMYEFIRETNDTNDIGDAKYRKTEHERNFFDKVRVFTVVATASGMRIRIHRAVEIPASNSITAAAQPGTRSDLVARDESREVAKRKRIVTTYPLQFEHEEYKRFDNHDYHHGDVVQEFEKIIWGYGQELAKLLREASHAVAAKFEAHPKLPRDHSYYRHGQEPKYYRVRAGTASPAPRGMAQPRSSARPRVVSPLSNVERQESSNISIVTEDDVSEFNQNLGNGVALDVTTMSQDSGTSNATLIRKAGGLEMDEDFEELNEPSTKRNRPSKPKR